MNTCCKVWLHYISGFHFILSLGKRDVGLCALLKTSCSTAIKLKMMSSCTLQWLLEAETSNLIGHQGLSHSTYKLSWPYIWPLNLPNVKLQLALHWVQRSKVGLWEGLLWCYSTQPEHPFWFLLQCLKSLQTGVDHSYVHTKQIPSKVYSVECVGCGSVRVWQCVQ